MKRRRRGLRRIGSDQRSGEEACCRRIHGCLDSVLQQNREAMMEGVTNAIGVVTTGSLLGAMLFFSGVMAPLIFTKLDAEVAGRFIRQVFPWYYLVIILLSGLAAAVVFFVQPAEAIALAGVAAAGIIARQVLMPRINRARDATLAGNQAADRPFARLHRLSVWINALQIVAVVVVLVRLIPAAA